MITYYTVCMDKSIYAQRTEERYTKRRMEQESYSFVRIFNWKTDKILLSYSDNFKSWKIYHLGDDEVCKALHILNTLASYVVSYIHRYYAHRYKTNYR